MSSVIVFLFVFGATMAFVGWPLVHPLLADEQPSKKDSARKALLEEKDRLISAIRDLDHDHRTGKLDDADHLALTDRLKRQAADVLRDLDVNAGRTVLRPGNSPAVPAPLPDVKVTADAPTIRVTHEELKQAGSKAAFCTKCGRQAKASDDKFCGKCGASLPTD